MLKELKALFAISTLACTITASLFSNTCNAYPKGYGPAVQPSYADMAVDAAIGRPLMFVTTVIGTGLFVITLPFTALSQSTGQAAQTLVVDPFQNTFQRCLGCLGADV